MPLEKLYERGARTIHIGGALLCVVLLASGWLFGLEPLMSETHQSSEIQEQADEAEHDAKLAKVGLDQMNAKLEAVRTELGEQPVSLQGASEINPLLAQLALWSEQKNLSITRTQAGRPESLSYYDYVPIEVAGEGSYTDLLAFFSLLHRDRGDLGVIAFEVQRMPVGVGISFELELAWYVISDVEPRTDTPLTASVPTE